VQERICNDTSDLQPRLIDTWAINQSISDFFKWPK